MSQSISWRRTTGCPIDAGSPSSSKSCREGQPGTNTSAETAQVFVATFFMPDATQPEKPVLLRKRFSRKPPPRQQPIFSHLNTTQEGTLTMAGGLGLPQQAPAAEAAPQGRSKRAPKPRKMWEVRSKLIRARRTLLQQSLLASTLTLLQPLRLTGISSLHPCTRVSNQSVQAAHALASRHHPSFLFWCGCAHCICSGNKVSAVASSLQFIA